MNPITLLQIELIKTTRRTAFWVTAGIFTLFGILILWAITGATGGLTVNGQQMQGLSLPSSWPTLMNIFKSFSTVFVPVTIILITASEFTFKTSRQNIIDGLSKEEFFSAKLLLVLFVVLVYFLLFFVVGFSFGAASTNWAEVKDPAIRGGDAAIFGAYLLVLFGYGVIAMFFSFITRSSGAALAFCLLYTLIIENLAATFLSLNETIKPAVKYFPTKIFDELLNPLRYDAAMMTQMKERFEQAKQFQPDLKFPDMIDTPVLFAIAIGYIVAIGAATYLVFKNRDL
ncbi:MAG: ABC transporter permease [Rhizobacter sp.]|nr:ABC transporter permease [Chlorobiales bacterium]